MTDTRHHALDALSYIEGYFSGGNISDCLRRHLDNLRVTLTAQTVTDDETRMPISEAASGAKKALDYVLEDLPRYKKGTVGYDREKILRRYIETLSRFAIDHVLEETKDNITTSKLKEAFGLFLNGMAYYGEIPDSEEDSKYLRKQATYNFLRARNHIDDELAELCVAAAKDVYATEKK